MSQQHLLHEADLSAILTLPLLRDKIENRQTITIGGSEIYTGQLHGVDVALLKSGIGKVAAA
ncbi:hypothetical protein ACNVD5_00285, partial [Klebsiella pneumoniae]